jgi:hypothetical protein
MKTISLSLALVFVLLASAAMGADAQKYAIGVKGMT